MSAPFDDFRDVLIELRSAISPRLLPLWQNSTSGLPDRPALRIKSAPVGIKASTAITPCGNSRSAEAGLGERQVKTGVGRDRGGHLRRSAVAVAELETPAVDTHVSHMNLLG